MVNNASGRGVDALAAEITTAGGTAAAVRDMSKPDDVQLLFEVTTNTFGRLDAIGK